MNRATSRPKNDAGEAPRRQANPAAKKPAPKPTAKKAAAARGTAALGAAARAESTARAELGAILARIHRTLDETDALLAD
ncbi:hypothetical protein GCM10009416_20550 [Craurococcus roseus]|uniref:Uncharacterized protein n=1 Tax=Craurococcus roseus TaxID=77585 RepID=A0ABN1F4D9_9PROT